MQISKKYTHYAAIVLFLFFGARLLYESSTAKDTVRVSCLRCLGGGLARS